jgi:hypothetical protein
LHSKEGKATSTWIPGIPQAQEGRSLLHGKGCIAASPPVWMLEMHRQTREMFCLVLELSKFSALERLVTPYLVKMSIRVMCELVKLLAEAQAQVQRCIYQGFRHMPGSWITLRKTLMLDFMFNISTTDIPLVIMNKIIFAVRVPLNCP